MNVKPSRCRSSGHAPDVHERARTSGLVALGVRRRSSAAGSSLSATGSSAAAPRRRPRRRRRRPRRRRRLLLGRLRRAAARASAAARLTSSRTGASGSSSRSIRTTVPPAASIFWRAEAEKPCACTVSATPISPSPRILTGCSQRAQHARGEQRLGRDLGAGLEARGERRDVHAVRVACGRGRSAWSPWSARRAACGTCMCSGIWPPIEPGAHHVRARAGLLALLTAARGLARAAALPRPTRLRSLVEPGAGERL